MAASSRKRSIEDLDPNSNIEDISSNPIFSTLDDFNSIMGEQIDLSSISDLISINVDNELEQCPFNDASFLDDVILNTPAEGATQTSQNNDSDPISLYSSQSTLFNSNTVRYDSEYKNTYNIVKDNIRTLEGARSKETFEHAWNSQDSARHTSEYLHGSRLYTRGGKPRNISKTQLLTIFRKTIDLNVDIQIIIEIMLNNSILANLYHDKYPKKIFMKYLRNHLLTPEHAKSIEKIINILNFQQLTSLHDEIDGLFKQKPDYLLELKKLVRNKMSLINTGSNNNVATNTDNMSNSNNNNGTTNTAVKPNSNLSVLAISSEDYPIIRSKFQSLTKKTHTAVSFTEVWNSCPQLHHCVHGVNLKSPIYDIPPNDCGILIIVKKAIELKVSPQVMSGIVINNDYLKNLRGHSQYPGLGLVLYLKNMKMIHDNIDVIKNLISLVKDKHLNEIYEYIVMCGSKAKNDDKPLFQDLIRYVEICMIDAGLMSDKDHRPGMK